LVPNEATRPQAIAPQALLDIENVSVSYGHVNALKNASLQVFKGEMVVLIGANGAGKTTLLETALGINTPASGRILFRGEPIGGVAVDRNVRGIFASMSVLDNLLLGAHNNMKIVAKHRERVYEWFPILKEREHQIARTLSGGERQMLAIGRALMSSPELIMVDEPSIGLAPIVVNDIFNILRMLNQEGYTILLSEQNANKALKCAHRGYVLETGTVALNGTATQLLNDPGVREAYLGA
jgi:branched-chain amino acid transport system ATP-binding protein